MREIKFRAWGHLEDEDAYQMFEPINVRAGGIPSVADMVICDASVMQFTGLKDMEGNEIYEDDIIEEDDPDDLGEIKKIEWRSAYSGPQFCAVDRFGEIEFYGGICNDCVKVIGNVHENPTLFIPVRSHGGGER